MSFLKLGSSARSIATSDKPQQIVSTSDRIQHLIAS
jgi:hypothetical protein